jgi:hypothetical protein
LSILPSLCLSQHESYLEEGRRRLIHNHQNLRLGGGGIGAGPVSTGSGI